LLHTIRVGTLSFGNKRLSGVVQSVNPFPQGLARWRLVQRERGQGIFGGIREEMIAVACCICYTFDETAIMACSEVKVLSKGFFLQR
jgi:hypothetical protein